MFTYVQVGEVTRINRAKDDQGKPKEIAYVSLLVDGVEENLQVHHSVLQGIEVGKLARVEGDVTTRLNAYEGTFSRVFKFRKISLHQPATPMGAAVKA